jgi:MoxR-like ATPase
VFATSNGIKRLSEPLLSRFRVMYLNEYNFSQFYEISVRRLLAEGLSDHAADKIAKSVWVSIVSWLGWISHQKCGVTNKISMVI